jgi:macrodomain Ter protein organizer (MatP/YcbG family)
MASNNRGVPTLSPALIRQTPPAQATEPEPADLAEENAEPVEGQGRSEPRAAVPRTRKRRPVAPSEKTNKRGLHLTDAVWDRLQLEAIRRRTTVSAIAGDVLERNLPRLRIERDA